MPRKEHCLQYEHWKRVQQATQFFFFFFFATLHMYFLQFINDCKSFLSTDLGIKKFLARRQIRKQEIYEDTCARVHTHRHSLSFSQPFLKSSILYVLFSPCFFHSVILILKISPRQYRYIPCFLFSTIKYTIE